MVCTFPTQPSSFRIPTISRSKLPSIREAFLDTKGWFIDAKIGAYWRNEKRRFPSTSTTATGNRFRKPLGVASRSRDLRCHQPRPSGQQSSKLDAVVASLHRANGGVVGLEHPRHGLSTENDHNSWRRNGDNSRSRQRWRGQARRTLGSVGAQRMCSVSSCKFVQVCIVWLALLLHCNLYTTVCIFKTARVLTSTVHTGRINSSNFTTADAFGGDAADSPTPAPKQNTSFATVVVSHVDASCPIVKGSHTATIFLYEAPFWGHPLPSYPWPRVLFHGANGYCTPLPRAQV